MNVIAKRASRNQSPDIANVDDSRDLVLQNINSAKDFLEKAKSLLEVKNVMELAHAAGIYAKRLNASTETINYAAEIRLRAERKLGEILKATPKATGTKGQGRPKIGGSIKEPPIAQAPKLSDIGISKKVSSRAQQMASLSAAKFEEVISVKPGEELSPSKVAATIQREGKETKRESRREENRVKVAQAPSASDAFTAGAKFATIVIDPPWDWGDEGDKDQLGRARPTYGTMPIGEIQKLPVGELADVDCHLYMWITNRSLPKGFALLDAWGFRYVTCITWCKPSIGMGNYFRGSTEQILFAVKGSQQLKRKDVGTWFSAPRGPNGHSSKPTEFYSLVESCSPGPMLEMFSRSSRPGWSVWGENSSVERLKGAA
jgi:N6-adenosine-specific RNA methylase IME4